MKAIRHFGPGEYTPTKTDMKLMPFNFQFATVVIEGCPKIIELLGYLASSIVSGNPTELPVHIGVARVHPEDRFNKKKGVLIASQKAQKAQYFYIGGHSHKIGNGRMYTEVVLDAVDGNQEILAVSLKLDYEGTYPEIISYRVNHNFNMNPHSKGYKA